MITNFIERLCHNGKAIGVHHRQTRQLSRSIGCFQSDKSTPGHQSSGSSDPQLKVFKENATKWWTGKEFSILRSMNEPRVPFIVNGLDRPIAQANPYRSMATASTNYHYHEKPPVHSHDKLWKAERYLSVALLGVLPAAWVIPHPIMDYAVATSLVVHVHWGIEAIVTDYVRPSVFGPVIPKISIALVYLLSILAAGGLFLFNWTDVGITHALRMLAKM